MLRQQQIDEVAIFRKEQQVLNILNCGLLNLMTEYSSALYIW
jgi:hypothetical protein